MIKTNSKKAKANILNYVMEWAGDYLQDNYGIEDITPDNIYSHIWTIFLKEAAPFSEYNRRYSLQSVFMEWAPGLPLGGLFCYYYNREAVADVMEILEETPEEAAKYNEDAACKLLTTLIYREMINNKG